MNALEAAQNAVSDLASHKLRSLLTMLGMIFGVAAVIAMLSIGAGAERQALEMIERMGLRNVLVRDKPADEPQEMRKKSLGVSERDARAIVAAVPGVEMAVPQVELDTYQVMAAGSDSEAAVVLGVSAHQRELSAIRVVRGRFIDLLDERTHAQVAVIGPAVARELFGYDDVLGQLLKIDDVWFEVIGLLVDSGSEDSFEGVDIGTTSNEIYIPYTTAVRKFDRDPLAAPLDQLTVRLAADTSPRQAASSIRLLMDRLHSGARDFELVVPEALLAQSRRTQRLFKIVMGCIAGISLLVGGIGIMNIMLATVLERTREIGIRRAVGARRIDIRRQFMIEAFSISLLGGVTGVVVGVAIARLVALSAGWPTVVTLTSILLSTSVSIAVGLVSGLYPALRAAELDPIDALRYE